MNADCLIINKKKYQNLLTITLCPFNCKAFQIPLKAVVFPVPAWPWIWTLWPCNTLSLISSTMSLSPAAMFSGVVTRRSKGGGQVVGQHVESESRFSVELCQILKLLFYFIWHMVDGDIMQKEGMSLSK